MASGGGGGGCACPGESKLSSITTTKHAVRRVPAILLHRELRERCESRQQEREQSEESIRLQVAQWSKRRSG